MANSFRHQKWLLLTRFPERLDLVLEGPVEGRAIVGDVEALVRIVNSQQDVVLVRVIDH